MTDVPEVDAKVLGGLLSRAIARSIEMRDVHNREFLAQLDALARLQLNAGHHAVALRLFEHTARIRLQDLGSDHPDSLKALSNVAGALAAGGMSAAARELLRRVEQIRSTVLGVDHPDTLNTLDSIAGTLTADGHPAQAASIYETIIERADRLHYSSLAQAATNNLAYTL
ncbi:tetratricopeptide repeat protein, partial [Gordonia sp. UBA7860]|uniref:tetratricopeptide repeat protein n=1 Tax=Gordonia sp. UBA7860 TaxID=1946579 RepID=UPI00257F5A5A